MHGVSSVRLTTTPSRTPMGNSQTKKNPVNKSSVTQRECWSSSAVMGDRHYVFTRKELDPKEIFVLLNRLGWFFPLLSTNRSKFILLLSERHVRSRKERMFC